MARKRRSPEGVYTVTATRRSRFAEVDRRTRTYLIQMGIRTLAVLLAIFVLHGWARFVALAAGLILPFIGVIGANAGGLPDERSSPEYVVANRQPSLPPGRDDPAARGRHT